MAANNSLSDEAYLVMKVQFVVLQVIVMIFLLVNLLLIIIFFKKEYFYTTARYILFAVTLLSDSYLLFITDVLLILTHFSITIQVWICLIIFTAVLLYITVTPVTLAAMTLERYVAICKPLRHGQLCSTQNIANIILLIHAISSVPGVLILSAFFVSASLSFYRQSQFCSVEIFILYIWQHNLRSGIYQVQFLIMVIIIVFSYVKIMRVARAASGENKQSSRKGLRTVALHGFQLLLCLMQMWCPFIEVAILQTDVGLYEIARYLNFLLFYLAPRCLSPLIYGLRDDVFFQALKYYVSFGLLKRNI